MLDEELAERAEPRAAEPNPNGQSVPSSREQPALIWRYGYLVVLLAIFGALVGGGLSALHAWTQTNRYVVSSEVRVGRPQALADQYTDPTYADRVLKTTQVIAGSLAVAHDAARTLDPTSNGADSLADRMSVTVNTDTELLNVSVAGRSAASVRRDLGAVVRAGQERVKSVYGNSVSFVEISPGSPTVSTVGANLAVAGLAGGLMGALIALLIGAARDQRAKGERSSRSGRSRR